MARSITTAAANASLAEVVRPLVLIDLDFPSGFVRVNSTLYSVTYSGNTYLGAGHVGEITPIDENGEIQAQQLALRLRGVPRDYVSLALAEQYQGRAATIRLGMMDESYALVVDPVIVFAGRMDVMSISLGETASVSVSIESRFADWERPRIRRYTSEDQALDYTGDKFFDYAPSMVDKTIKWGRQ